MSVYVGNDNVIESWCSEKLGDQLRSVPDPTRSANLDEVVSQERFEFLTVRPHLGPQQRQLAIDYQSKFAAVDHDLQAARWLRAPTAELPITVGLRGLEEKFPGGGSEPPTGPLAGTNRSQISAVLAEQDDRWQVVSFHNTLLQTPGPHP